MIGSFLTRGIVLLLGYIYPAYECFKTVERRRPDLTQLRFWCQYWIIIAILTVLERLGDTFVSWLPMYCEAKLAFVVYLWYPKTRGTTYVYSTFLKPLVARHELEIDRSMNELKIRAGDMLFLYWQRGSGYMQTRFFDLLQYIALQSQSPRPQTAERPVEHAETHSARASYQAAPGYQPSPANYPALSDKQPPASYQVPPGNQPPPSYQVPPSCRTLSATHPAPRGYELPPSSCQAQPASPPHLPPEHYPTAPPVPPDYDMHPESGVIHPPTAMPQQILQNEETGFEVMDATEQPAAPGAPESSTKSSFYMTRSRQRISHRQ